LNDKVLNPSFNANSLFTELTYTCESVGYIIMHHNSHVGGSKTYLFNYALSAMQVYFIANLNRHPVAKPNRGASSNIAVEDIGFQQYALEYS
jgi:hypothetical protein